MRRKIIKKLRHNYVIFMGAALLFSLIFLVSIKTTTMDSITGGTIIDNNNVVPLGVGLYILAVAAIGAVLMVNETKKIPTGISALDSIMKGGLEKNSINLVIDDQEVNEGNFIFNIITSNIKNQNIPAVYIRYGEKEEEKVADDKFLILPYKSYNLEKLTDNRIRRIKEEIRRIKAKQLIIDFPAEQLLTNNGKIIPLFKHLEKINCTTIINIKGNVTHKALDYLTKYLETEVDNIVFFYNIQDRKDDTISRFLLLYKEGEYNNKVFQIRLGSGNVKQ